MKFSEIVSIKENINQYDIGNVVDIAAEFVINRDVDGNVYYRPYFMDEGIKYGVILYLVDGITMDPEDNLLDVYDKEEKLSKVVDEFTSGSALMDDIITYTKDVIDYRKKLYTSISDVLAEELKTLMHKEEILNETLIEAARVQRKVLEQQAQENDRNAEIMSHLTEEEILSMQKKLATGEFNMKDLVDQVVNKYVDSELHKKNAEEVKSSKVVDYHEIDDGK